MKKLLGIVVLGLLLSGCGGDPDVEGCVYDTDFGNKISCVSGITYDEAYHPGSLKKAEQLCMAMLREDAHEAGITNFQIEGCFDMSVPANR